VGAALTAGLLAAAVGGGQAVIAAPAKAPHRVATAWLNGVSATSAHDVWAVGAFGHADGSAPLIEHWNGSKWQATKPFLNQEENEDFFTGVSATSGTSAVAAGSVLDQYGLLLGEHWNGHKWTEDFMPIVGPDDGTAVISGTAAVQGGSSWAVGNFYGGPKGTAQAQLTMILRWNAAKNTWVRVKSPSPAGNGSGAASVLNAVASDSPTDAWAVGRTSSGPSSQVNTLIEHWDGSSWTVVSSPDPAQPKCGDDELLGVTASPAGTWAVGDACGAPIVLQLKDGQWQAKSTPSGPAGVPEQLSSVAVASASNAWAVGNVGLRPLILHWNGTRWGKPRIAFPAGATSATFTGVTAVSPTAAWAVGKANFPHKVTKLLIEHWNGKKWTLISAPNPTP
jgi:hypothetical protein